jgi:ACS family hexuronate transporter-like MFS transporter
MNTGHVKGLRWWVIGLVTLCVIINYLDRSTLSVAITTLKSEFNISTEQYSYAVSAFQFAYMLMQPAAGWLLDVMGTKIGFAVFATCWSLACMLHALLTGWISMTFFRSLLGLSESAVIPASMKVVAEWFPDREKSVATGWFNSGTSIGAMIAPPVVAWCLINWSWQIPFIGAGVIGLVWVAAWLVLYRDTASHPKLSPEERALIRDGQTHAPAERVQVSRWAMLRSRNLWGIMIARFFGAPAWATFSFWIPIYLSTARHMSLKEIALFAWMPFLAADLGSIVGGYLCPIFMRWFGVTLITSRKMVVATGAILMFGPACIGLVTDKYVAVALFCIGGFAHQALSGALITLASDVFPKNEVATASGWTGSAAWLAQALFSLVIGALASRVGYDPLFVALGFFDVIATVVVWKMLPSGLPETTAMRRPAGA